MMQEDWKPKMGMVFDNIEDAWKFWVDYGGRLGFGARKQYTHKKKDGSIISCLLQRRLAIARQARLQNNQSKTGD